MTRESLSTTHLPVLVPSPVYCAGCVSRLLEAVEALPGVESAEADPRSATLTVSFDAERTTQAAIDAEVRRLGFEISAGTAHAAYRLTGLDCPDCARTVDKSVGYIEGVRSADLNFASGVLLVEYDEDTDCLGAVTATVRRMGYGIEPLEAGPRAESVVLRLAGLDCSDCAETLRGRVAGLAGVRSAAVDFGSALARVSYDPRVTDPDTIARTVTATGYRAEALGAELPESLGWKRWWQTHGHAVLTGTAGAAFLTGWALGFADARTLGNVAYALAIVIGGALTARRAWAAVRARSLDMNVLMTLAVVGAAAIGEWSEGAAVVVLFAIGNLLEARSLARTRASIRALMDLAPPRVRVRRGAREVDAAPAEVRVGETVIVRAGERVALDATVTRGSSAFDESPITGEAAPVDKSPGDRLFAGTLNTFGLLEAEVTVSAADSTLARLVHLVEEAQASRAPSQRLVDRFTRYYTPAVVGLAAAIAVLPPLAGAVTGSGATDWTEWFRRALVMLVVSCPCALVISTPVAIVSAITRATRDGVLVKGGVFLETAPRIEVVAFDKTGTLTVGRPEVEEVVALNGADRTAVLRAAAALESGSTHPVAEAVLRAAGAHPGVDHLEDFLDSAGQGVRARIGGVAYTIGSPSAAQSAGMMDVRAVEEVARLEREGKSVLVLTSDAKVIGVIGLADRVRSESADVVASLMRDGVRHLVMLTGDNDRTAAAVALHAGVPEYRARLMPQDKVDAVRELRERYGPVMMVGDGVNDAPALALADVGVAVGAAGSDTALENADVALLGDGLRALPSFLALGKRTARLIRQNIAFSLVVKAAVLVLAFVGVATLWMAVFADTGVSLLVTLNGLRSLRAQGVSV